MVKETFTGVWEDAIRISAADAPMTVVTHNWVNGVDPEKRLQEIAENDAFIAAYYQNVYLPNKEKEEKRQEAIQWLADNKARTDEAARVAKEQEIAETIAAQKAAALYKKMTRDEEYTEDKNVFQMDYAEMMKKFHEKETAGGLIDPMNPYGSANYIYHDQIVYDKLDNQKAEAEEVGVVPLSDWPREIAASFMNAQINGLGILHDVVGKPTEKTIAFTLNAAIAGLGKAHDEITKPTEIKDYRENYGLVSPFFYGAPDSYKITYDGNPFGGYSIEQVPQNSPDNGEAKISIGEWLNSKFELASVWLGKELSKKTYYNESGELVPPENQEKINNFSTWVVNNTNFVFNIANWVVNKVTGQPIMYENMEDLACHNNYLSYERWDTIFGNGPNWHGIKYALDNSNTINNIGNEEIDPILIANGLATQFEHSDNFLDALQKLNLGLDDGVGPAEVSINTLSEMYNVDVDVIRENMGPGQTYDPYNPDIAAEAIKYRIEKQINTYEVNKYCSETDKFIISLMAQNDFQSSNLFDKEGTYLLPPSNSVESSANINWIKYLSSQNAYTIDENGSIANNMNKLWMNVRTSGDNYNTEFILQNAVHNIDVLIQTGQYDIPEGVNYDYIKNLVEALEAN